jgi:heavy metal efflux system protein
LKPHWPAFLDCNPGLQSTRSLSRNGFSQVTAVFEDDVDIYFARQQITERLNEARENLPPGVEPKMGAIATGLGEIYMWTVEYEHPHGKGASIDDGKPGWQKDGSYLTPEGHHLTSDFDLATYLRTVQDWVIRPQIKGVKDVAGVDSIGGYIKEYHVQPEPMKLVSYGLTFKDVIEALEKNNVSTGAGYIEHKGEGYNVRVAGRIKDEDGIRNIVLGERNGTPIYVRDVADVLIGKELRRGSASENGEEVVLGTAMMLIGANSRTVSQAVDDKLALVNKALPPGVRAKTVLNRTKLVDATIATVQKNLAEGAIFVVIVLFLMLGNIRAAFICALAIPLSMLMTATGMVQGRVSGNLLSLGAIDFGIIIDGAVIIVENCLRRLGDRQHQLGRALSLGERLDEVTQAAKEMIKPSAFGQAIIITVYLPILFLTGIEGKMFRPMAITVVLALVAAFVLSLTVVPALVALLIRGRVQEKENFIVRSAKRAYLPAVTWAVRGRWVVVPLAVIAFVASLLLFSRLGQEFVPVLDEKDIAMHAMRIPSTGLDQSSRMQFAVEKAVTTVPEVAFAYSKTGTAEMGADPAPPSVSDTFIILKPRSEWADPNEPKPAVIQRIEEAVSKIPGHKYEFLQPIQMRFNELIAGVRSDVAVKVYGDEFDEMVPAAEAIEKILKDIPGAEDVLIEQVSGLPVMTVEIDRAAAARHGINVSEVQDIVSTAVGGREAGLVFEGDRRFDLVVRLPEEIRRDIAALKNLPIPLRQPEANESRRTQLASLRGDGGAASIELPGYIPLSSVARIDIAEGPNQISRENGKRRVVVQANVRGRDIGSFVAEAQRKVGESVELPTGYLVDWGGQFENLIAARERLMIVVPVCFFVIFVLLFMTFGSAKYAVIVFSGVPLALTGGIVALWLRGMPFSISAAVGFIALSGVAVLNGVVMVTFINQMRLEGAELEHAIVQGSLTRLRPVLMTALVAALGFVPMAIATGTGAEVQKPLATVVIGGIISSTLLTLLVLPALYRMWHFNNPNRKPSAPERAAETPVKGRNGIGVVSQANPET